MKLRDSFKVLALAGAVLAAEVFAQTGVFKDPRDGRAYRTVKIGNQTWMAQNLNYKTGDSKCGDNDEANCEKYGRLYTWKAAKRACPNGWHLPIDTEWHEMIQAAGCPRYSYTPISLYRWYEVNKTLKSKTGWKDGANGTDAAGFSALPESDGGERASWWGVNDNGDGWRVEIYYGWDDGLVLSNNWSADLYHIRCVEGRGTDKRAEAIIAAAGYKDYDPHIKEENRSGIVIAAPKDPLNLRGCPQLSDDCKPILALERGTVVSVLGETEDHKWYKVSWGADGDYYTGFVSANFIGGVWFSQEFVNDHWVDNTLGQREYMKEAIDLGILPAGYNVRSIRLADLNKDGRSDFVIEAAKIINPKIGYPEEAGIIVALQEKNGKYKTVVKNLKCLAGDPGPVAQYVKVKDGNLFVIHDPDCSDHSYNFRWQNGAFELIGYDTKVYHCNDGLEETGLHMEMSVNFLTNKIKTKHEDNGFKEKWEDFTLEKPIKLQDIGDFSIFNVMKAIGRK